MSQPALNCAAPCFVVRTTPTAVAFYRDQLGFTVLHHEPADDPFFAVLVRGGAMLMLKSVGVDPQPNATRHPWARWDAYVNAPDPDALAAEFLARGVVFSKPLEDTPDGLRGFELQDLDGYTLFFGRPREDPQ
jgi:catechol 2,3-dioxygenase-like lactoylglutathione lyase family enzyme